MDQPATALRGPASTVLGQLAAGRDAAQILADLPDLEPADIPAALECTAAAVRERELPLVTTPSGSVLPPLPRPRTDWARQAAAARRRAR